MALVSTDDVLSDEEIAYLYDDELLDVINREKPIQVCAGEWQRECPGRWRFWRDTDFASH